ncbi:hypothetical protein RHODO2019_19135 (plasmid) [Rhodococcus antarcticus]|jgi:hypothetical protein|uniref:ABC-type Mn/Zn transport systems, ATPase component n=1 Tax=Rhodococcus antarcticus TaxID=2987751 RepID=A0ABY6P5U4_9NOCA|nr:hypothetical protein [Rhodococcus antarcticus]UZJ27045.1 hypothetical protein RHODO2019_19135 [Rhodococcus antarcticus]
MSPRNTLIRSMHDLGAAAWFGGSLMGALGVNGAAAAVADPTDRAKVAAAGWAKWAPVNAAAIGAHLLGGTGLLLANRGRAAHQAGVRANTVTKLVVTGLALGTTAYSGILGAKTAQGDGHHVTGATEPSATTPPDVAAAQKQLKVLQWVTPVLTAAIVVLGAQQGEQQRPTQIVRGLTTTLGRRTGR